MQRKLILREKNIGFGRGKQWFEENWELAGHGREKEAVVPRQECAREEKSEKREVWRGMGEKKKPWCPAGSMREKKK